jgi:hypothetical protein
MDAAGSAPLSRLERDRLALWGEPRSPHEILLAEIRASSGGIVSPSQLSAPASPQLGADFEDDDQRDYRPLTPPSPSWRCASSVDLQQSLADLLSAGADEAADADEPEESVCTLDEGELGDDDVDDVKIISSEPAAPAPHRAPQALEAGGEGGASPPGPPTLRLGPNARVCLYPPSSFLKTAQLSAQRPRCTPGACAVPCMLHCSAACEADCVAHCRCVFRRADAQLLVVCIPGDAMEDNDAELAALAPSINNIVVERHAELDLTYSTLEDVNDGLLALQYHPVELQLTLRAHARCRLPPMPSCTLTAVVQEHARLSGLHGGSDVWALWLQLFAHARCDGLVACEDLMVVRRGNSVTATIGRRDKCALQQYRCVLGGLAICKLDDCPGHEKHQRPRDAEQGSTVTINVLGRRAAKPARLPEVKHEPAASPVPAASPQPARQMRRDINRIGRQAERLRDLRDRLSACSNPAYYQLDDEDEAALDVPAKLSVQRSDKPGSNIYKRDRKLCKTLIAEITEHRRRAPSDPAATLRHGLTNGSLAVEHVRDEQLMSSKRPRRSSMAGGLVEREVPDDDAPEWRLTACISCGCPARIVFSCGHSTYCAACWTRSEDAAGDEEPRRCGLCRATIEHATLLL